MANLSVYRTYDHFVADDLVRSAEDGAEMVDCADSRLPWRMGEADGAGWHPVAQATRKRRVRALLLLSFATMGALIHSGCSAVERHSRGVVPVWTFKGKYIDRMSLMDGRGIIHGGYSFSWVVTPFTKGDPIIAITANGGQAVLLDEEANTIWYIEDILSPHVEGGFPKQDVVFEPFSEGMSAFRIGGEFGYIDSKGKVVIPARYTTACEFSCGRALVSLCRYSSSKPYRNLRSVVIDRRGRVVYDGETMGEPSMGKYSEGRIIAIVPGGYQYIDTSGRSLSNEVHLYAAPFYEGRAVAASADSGLMGYVGRNGEWAISPIYELCGNFRDGLAVVRKQDKSYTVVNRSGRELIDPVFLPVEKARIERIDPFFLPIHDDMASLGEKRIRILAERGPDGTPILGSGGPVNSTCPRGDGKKEKKQWLCRIRRRKLEIIRAFDLVFRYENGLCRVVENRRTGFCDRNGNVVIPCVYDFADNFGDNGLAFVLLADTAGYIDRRGRLLWLEPSKEDEEDEGQEDEGQEDEGQEDEGQEDEGQEDEGQEEGGSLLFDMGGDGIIY